MAERCEASAEPIIGCLIANAEATTVAEVVGKRCLANAEAVARASSARDAERIERQMTTAPADSMF
jgi:hypothetical protein